MSSEVEAWEGEGGAAALPRPVPLLGTANQVEWAERIKHAVNNEFDRVVASFRTVAAKQQNGKRAATEAIIAIVEDKRRSVMSREDAGYFIHDWQEIDDQVRQMVAHDSRYREIKLNKEFKSR